MTTFEILRMVCYAIAPLALLYKALALIHQRHYGGAWLRLFMLALFIWYMVELTMIGHGIDTRRYRIIGTPMIVGVTAVAVAQAWSVWKYRRTNVEDNANE